MTQTMTPADTDFANEALPHIRTKRGKMFVVKYGGSAMTDEGLKDSFAQDVTILKNAGIRIVIVHGGGKEITDLTERLKIPRKFIHGQRYTDDATMEVVQMVLAGKTNKDIVARINRHGGGAAGLCGIDADLLRVTKYCREGTDLGRVGEIIDVNTSPLHLLLNNDIMPVVAPVGVDEQWQAYNINADLVAADIACAMNAERLLYLSDVEGVVAAGRLIRKLDREGARRLIDQNVVVDGMIPKIQAAFEALAGGVNTVHLIDGRVPHSIVLDLFCEDGIGTALTLSSEHAPAVSP